MRPVPGNALYRAGRRARVRQLAGLSLGLALDVQGKDHFASPLRAALAVAEALRVVAEVLVEVDDALPLAEAASDRVEELTRACRRCLVVPERAWVDLSRPLPTWPAGQRATIAVYRGLMTALEELDRTVQACIAQWPNAPGIELARMHQVEARSIREASGWLGRLDRPSLPRTDVRDLLWNGALRHYLLALRDVGMERGPILVGAPSAPPVARGISWPVYVLAAAWVGLALTVWGGTLVHLVFRSGMNAWEFWIVIGILSVLVFRRRRA